MATLREMQQMAGDFFARHPDVRLAALGARENAASMDLAPFGVPLHYYPAEEFPNLVERYRDANALAFPGDLALPGWVLSDLYLLPNAIGLLTCPGHFIDVPTRKRLNLHPDDLGIAAAYFCSPSIRPGAFIGVSLLSLVPRIVAGAWVKALTLRMVRATELRGVAQWRSPAVRVHTRMGPLRVVSGVPGTHEFRARSFVYESDLSDPETWTRAMARKAATAPSEKIPATDSDALQALCERAEHGERIYVVPPGLDAGGNVLVRFGSAT